MPEGSVRRTCRGDRRLEGPNVPTRPFERCPSVGLSMVYHSCPARVLGPSALPHGDFPTISLRAPSLRSRSLSASSVWPSNERAEPQHWLDFRRPRACRRRARALRELVSARQRPAARLHSRVPRRGRLARRAEPGSGDGSLEPAFSDPHEPAVVPARAERGLIDVERGRTRGGGAVG